MRILTFKTTDGSVIQLPMDKLVYMSKSPPDSNGNSSEHRIGITGDWFDVSYNEYLDVFKQLSRAEEESKSQL